MHNFSADNAVPLEQNDLALLQLAARQAGEIACRYVGQETKISYKEGGSPVTEADLQVDAFLKKFLLTARPHYGWVSEESLDVRESIQEAEFFFVVDPIDGTRGFIEQSQYWCISIAIVNRLGESIVAVLYCPILNVLYHAQKGQGAYQNGLSLQPMQAPVESGQLHLSCSQHISKKNIPLLSKKAKLDTTIPSVAYRIVLVAHGYFDAVLIRPKCNDWDMAAADLILQENQGIICDRDKKKIRYLDFESPHGFLIATRHVVMDKIIAWLDEVNFL